MNLIEDIYIFSHLFDLTLKNNLCSDFSKLKPEHIKIDYMHYQKKYLFLYGKYHESLSKKTDEYINFFKDAREVLSKKNDA